MSQSAKEFGMRGVVYKNEAGGVGTCLVQEERGSGSETLDTNKAQIKVDMRVELASELMSMSRMESSTFLVVSLVSSHQSFTGLWLSL